MKTAMAFLIALASTAIMAETTITLPLFVEVNNELVKTSAINKKYKLKGDEKLVEQIIIGTSAKSTMDARNLFWAENEKADKVAAKYNADFFLAMLRPENVECYSGKPWDAVGIIGNLTDGPFSDQMGFWGWRYKSEIHLEESDDYEATVSALNKRSSEWKNWKGLDESILVITHQTDDGDDINEAVIKACSK